MHLLQPFCHLYKLLLLILVGTLTPGDVLTVMLAQTDKEPNTFAALSGGGTSFSDVRVDHNGNVEIPFVGWIKAQGLTTVALAERIKKWVELSIKNPEVRVTLSSDISGSVLVSSAVKAPGRYSSNGLIKIS